MQKPRGLITSPTTTAGLGVSVRGVVLGVTLPTQRGRLRGRGPWGSRRQT